MLGDFTGSTFTWDKNKILFLFLVFSSSHTGSGISAASCSGLGRWLCQAPGPVTGMHTGTGSPLCETLALANLSGHRPASARWASDSPWPWLHQSPPPPSMSRHRKRLPGGEREGERGSLWFLKPAVQNTLQHPRRFPVGLLSSSLPVKTTQASRGRSALPQKGGLWGPPLLAAALQQRDSSSSLLSPACSSPSCPAGLAHPWHRGCPGQPCRDTNTLLSQGTRLPWPRPQGLPAPGGCAGALLPNPVLSRCPSVNLERFPCNSDRGYVLCEGAEQTLDKGWHFKTTIWGLLQAQSPEKREQNWQTKTLLLACEYFHTDSTLKNAPK